MSALGQKRTFAAQYVMSALLPIATAKADICASSCPLYPRKQTSHRLFDHPVGPALNGRAIPSATDTSLGNP
jgi:hypothetical protein